MFTCHSCLKVVETGRDCAICYERSENDTINGLCFECSDLERMCFTCKEWETFEIIKTEDESEAL
jgi:hypothetical protein